MPDFSPKVLEVLRLLRDRHNVLISGPPGTGKSRLLGEVARAFLVEPPNGPVHVPGSAVAIPRTPPIPSELRGILPSADRKKRQVFRTVFHQNSKHRDFITGLTPVVGTQAGGGGTTFRIVEGTLYRASQFAIKEGGASLLIIDEINRGPAVQVFGPSIVGIESDKRLLPDGNPKNETQYFEISDPETGNPAEYALPHQLYILAAMNQADTSVEPLDVAFLRRWTPFHLEPDVKVLRSHFQLPERSTDALPESPTAVSNVFEAAVRAWVAVNTRICLGRGPEFQIGHGVLMGRERVASTVKDALEDVAESWRSVRAHIDEVFFGDTRGVAAALNVEGASSHLYALDSATFADEPRLMLVGPDVVDRDRIYRLLLAVTGEGNDGSPLQSTPPDAS